MRWDPRPEGVWKEGFLEEVDVKMGQGLEWWAGKEEGHFRLGTGVGVQRLGNRNVLGRSEHELRLREEGGGSSRNVLVWGAWAAATAGG